MTYSSARIWSPGRRANFEHFELARASINFKVFKVASAGQGRHTNFEHFELGRCSINFKVFKVASAGQCRHTNFENIEVGGEPTSLKMFKVEPGPWIKHDTPCRTSPVPEPFKCQRPKSGRLWQGKLSAAHALKALSEAWDARLIRAGCPLRPPPSAAEAFPPTTGVAGQPPGQLVEGSPGERPGVRTQNFGKE